MQLSDFTTLTFDCYGTLIDWESGMFNALKPLTDRVKTPLTRDEVLQAHALAESTQQKLTPAKKYSDLLAVVYKRLAETWHLTVSWDECITYGQSIQHWPAFQDSAESLKYLKQHYKLVILSNVDNLSFAHSNAKLHVKFDAVYTAEDAGAYKPADSNFEYMLANLSAKGINKSEILHTAESLFHDHVPANRHELHNCWIYRRHDQDGFGSTRDPGDMPTFDFKFNSMMALVEAHQAL